MPVDEMMSDQSSPAQANTVSALDEIQAKGSAAWEIKKFREEYDTAKGKLLDAKFDPAEYPDPLLPRPGVKAAYARSFPAGTEERLRKLVAMVEGRSA